MDKKQELQKKILDTFKAEAKENIESISASLLELEKGVNSLREMEIFELLYRTAHSLKGAARAVDYEEIESLCHALEDVMSAIRDKKIVFNAALFDLLFQTVDIVQNLVHLETPEISTELSEAVSNQLDQLALAESGVEMDSAIDETKPDSNVANNKHFKKAAQKQPPELHIANEEEPGEQRHSEIMNSFKETKHNNETIRISASNLNSLLIQSEEMVTLKLAASNRIEKLQTTLNKIVEWNKKSSEAILATQNLSRNSSSKSEGSAEQNDINGIVNFCEWSKNRMNNIETELNELLVFSKNEEHTIHLKIDNLLDDVKELIKVPFSHLLDGFPRMIRDISKKLNKEVDFIVEGDSIEIDRRILEEIRSPLMHILRNAVDYGIEKPEVRIEQNKPRKGTIHLKIDQHRNHQVELNITDDGAGINLERLSEVFLRNEAGSPQNEKISKKELLNSIFRSGISTSDLVTDISGRGLGMAIAQETIEKLGGKIEVETEKNRFTNFKIRLPLSVISFRGVLFEVSGRKFIVPSHRIERVVRVSESVIQTVNNRATIPFEDKIITLVKLTGLFGIPEEKNESGYIQVLIFRFKGEYIAFEIDRVIGEQEVLVKKFNKQLSRVRNVLGATILGSGEVVPILNVADLFKSSEKMYSSARSVAEKVLKAEKRKSSVLIVEDSVTSRTLLKNILESSGYSVTVAIDGIDGLTKLKEGRFDVVVSDIEMPRMDGFELTKKIRDGRETAELPVVLVTSLSKREHREKGIDVGANAYIIKSNFDQSNLLEVLNRLT